MTVVQTKAALRWLLSAMLIVGLFGSPAAMAQDDGQDQAASLEVIQAELEILRQSLASLRERVMAANPSLQARQSSLQDQIMSLMRDDGIQPRKEIRRLQDMARQLREDPLDETQRAELLQTYQQSREALLQARSSAMNDEDVVREQTRLQDDLVAAMTAENAEVPAMIERFETLRSQLAAAMRRTGAPGNAR